MSRFKSVSIRTTGSYNEIPAAIPLAATSATANVSANLSIVLIFVLSFRRNVRAATELVQHCLRTDNKENDRYRPDWMEPEEEEEEEEELIVNDSRFH
jgi:hypothetical protein